ncbi:hypothetical protein CesoFtcFv8_001795 [Champsocephalus esox]|uniref:Uncharacterized protein n=1 Tax=Champsocephalus esox TaxID=159716 RepID=A0AAN8CWL7_9TELE|nr:hypothetical protein CesoFtcFv8_001795 [Champsocephalus esox]
MFPWARRGQTCTTCDVHCCITLIRGSLSNAAIQLRVMHKRRASAEGSMLNALLCDQREQAHRVLAPPQCNGKAVQVFQLLAFWWLFTAWSVATCTSGCRAGAGVIGQL